MNRMEHFLLRLKDIIASRRLPQSPSEGVLSYGEGVRRYDSNAVSDIVRRALLKQGADETISHEELIETAAQLGIDTERLEEVIRQREQEMAMEAARAEWRSKERREFHEHLTAYIIVNFALFLMDIFITGGTWFFWVLLGWGIGLAFDAVETFFPSAEKLECGAKKILKKREAPQRFG